MHAFKLERHQRAESSGLVIVDHLDVPEAVLSHRFVAEGLRLLATVADEDDFRDRVIGTGKATRKAQLYGWAKDTAEHQDKTGVIYGVCLTPGNSKLFARAGEDNSAPVLEVELSVGAVFRLDDYLPHWTEDSGHRLAAFAGPYPEPNDSAALALLETGITHLAAGSYYDAPRVGLGYFQLQADECWATHDFQDRELMLIADAKERGHHILECSLCEQPAAKIDHYWPFHFDQNLCSRCAEDQNNASDQ